MLVYFTCLLNECFNIALKVYGCIFDQSIVSSTPLFYTLYISIPISKFEIRFQIVFVAQLARSFVKKDILAKCSLAVFAFYEAPKEADIYHPAYKNQNLSLHK